MKLHKIKGIAVTTKATHGKHEDKVPSEQISTTFNISLNQLCGKLKIINRMLHHIIVLYRYFLLVIR
jgi:hypothetical protein